MAVYPEVPAWWYGAVGVVALVFGLIAIEVYDTGLPVWALAVSLLVGYVFVIPIGIIRAVTNQLFSINVFTEFFGGYILKDNPVAVMLFKTYGFIPTTTALTFVSDLKIGHYMKVPPRMMFMAQTVSTIIGAICMSSTQDLLIQHIPNICTPEAKDGFTCPGVTTFTTSSIIWGAIGPKRIFSIGAL